MNYIIRLHPFVLWQIRNWGLSEDMLIEVRMRLHDDLAQDSIRHLHLDPDGPGNLFVFSARDPADPDFQQIFMFRVFFDQDESHLDIVHGSYWRNFDPQAR